MKYDLYRITIHNQHKAVVSILLTSTITNAIVLAYWGHPESDWKIIGNILGEKKVLLTNGDLTFTVRRKTITAFIGND